MASLALGQPLSARAGVAPLPAGAVGLKNSEERAPAALKVSQTCDSRENALTAEKEKDVLPAGIDCTTWYTVIVGIARTREARRAL